MKRRSCPRCEGPAEVDTCRTIAHQVGALLTAARENAEVSRAEVARRLDVHPNTLREIEHGQANVSIDRLEAILAGYGLEVSVTAAGPPGTMRPLPGTRRTTTRGAAR